MRLYTCGVGPVGGSFPLLKHPCGLAADALKQAGHAFEIEKVKGFKNIPFSTPKGARDEVKALTGQEYVPVLVLDDGTAIAGEREIAEWAKAHPAG
ncbi:MAG: glutathione S-transferase domain-containing protein [Solirubrobacteraceae bacterium]|nr:glutathione S-transferase domain-containing protein [Solirubrobacteraceae bacterium]